MIPFLEVGSVLTICGAFVFMTLQTSFVRSRWSSDPYKECRRQLYDITSVTNEHNEELHSLLTKVVERNWEGELSEVLY